MSSKEGKNTNQLLFSAIEQKVAKSEKWKQACQKVLNIGRTALYNRINGTTPLLFEEAIILAQKYGISLDALVENRPFLLAQHSAQNFDSQKNIKGYFQLIIDQFHSIKEATDVTFHYTSNDLPIFYYALVPKVFAFKLFAWSIAMPHSEKQRQQKFSLKSFSCQIPELALIKQALQAYSSYPSVEIWPAKILDNTLNQLEFYSRTHRFQHIEDIVTIYEGLELLINKIFNEYIVTGKKSSTKQEAESGQSLSVYYNEIIQINTILLVSGHHFHRTYCVFDSPHFLISEDPWLKQYTQLWFKYLISSSSQISQSNMGLRNEILEKFIRQIRQSKEKALKWVE